jgi:hypothetical protein
MRQIYSRTMETTCQLNLIRHPQQISMAVQGENRNEFLFAIPFQSASKISFKIGPLGKHLIMSSMPTDQLNYQVCEHVDQEQWRLLWRGFVVDDLLTINPDTQHLILRMKTTSEAITIVGYYIWDDTTRSRYANKEIYNPSYELEAANVVENLVITEYATPLERLRKQFDPVKFYTTTDPFLSLCFQDVYYADGDGGWIINKMIFTKELLCELFVDTKFVASALCLINIFDKNIDVAQELSNQYAITSDAIKLLLGSYVQYLLHEEIEEFLATLNILTDVIR